MKHLKKFNEESSKFFGREILPDEALRQLEGYTNSKDDKIEVYPDPKVEGTYAVRVYRSDMTFDLLWYKGGFDEVSTEGNEFGFETWPPISSDLKFL